MSEEKFDAIIVGAGPAGIAAAITMARAGLNVVVLERGEYAGAKNVQGAILYTQMLDELVPGFWKEDVSPMERYITEQKFCLLSEDAAMQVGFKSEKWVKEPHNCYSIIRVNFDRWFSKKAEAVGAQVFTGVTVSEVIKKDGRVVGIRTSENDELFADVIIACDGVNSMLAQQVGLIDEWKADEVALGVKEVLALPKEKINDRFCLEQNEGTTFEMFGNITRGMLGYCFLYTNKESLSLGVGCKLSHFQKSLIRPYDLLESIKQHPFVRRLIAGSKTLEYSAHLIPEGGYNAMPPLYSDGFLIAGDAAQMVDAAHREGSNLAMTSGKLAGETVIEAKKAGDFSKKTLALYQKKLEASYVLPDLYDHRFLETEAEKRMPLFEAGPELVCQSAYDFFNVDGKPKRDAYAAIVKRVFGHPAVNAQIKTELKPGNLFNHLKVGVQMGWKLFKLRRQALSAKR